MCSKKGEIYISVAPEVINASTELCIETGAILEAHKFNDIITHSICVVRDDEYTEFKVLNHAVHAKKDYFIGGTMLR
ncbi:cytidine deaminase [Staphylococcus chromogenes MU 970]|nr:cytidine deaminase [Staphylococcus chromogenes MU 970]